MLTPEKMAAAAAADLAAALHRRLRSLRNGKRMPAVHFAGRWLEELGFTIGQALHARVRDGELVVSVAAED